jgi:DNA-binding XRE family transcriptional regulator
MPDMIKNDQHYETTKYWVEKFAHTLDSLRRRSKDSLKDLHPLLAKVQEDAAASVLQDLKDQMREYESLKAGQFPMEKLKVADELPFILIKARIAQGLSQKDLAEQVGLEEHQIQQYEAKDYESATLATIRNVATVLYCGAGNPALAIKSG